MSDTQRVALAVGAGDAIGAAFARRFAAGGLKVAVARRTAEKSDGLRAEIENAGGEMRAFSMDTRAEADVVDLVETVEREMGPIDVCLYNAGANSRFPIAETSADMFEKIWRLGCFGGFLVGREAAKVMVPRGRGTILYTGATASIRGGAGFAAFASSKFGLRALSQSLARELGPQGIHVAHLVIDGGVNSEAIWARRRAAAGGQDVTFPPDSLMELSSIAEAYWTLYQQPRNAWTHELDIRPFSEKW